MMLVVILAIAGGCTARFEFMEPTVVYPPSPYPPYPPQPVVVRR